MYIHVYRYIYIYLEAQATGDSFVLMVMKKPIRIWVSLGKPAISQVQRPTSTNQGAEHESELQLGSAQLGQPCGIMWP